MPRSAVCAAAALMWPACTPTAQVSGPCVADGRSITCAHQTRALDLGDHGTRDVHFAVPTGTPPAQGWPVALVFHGALAHPRFHWQATKGTPGGAYHQVRLTAALLESGYAVLTPESMGEGLTCWNTNVPGWAGDWPSAPDHALMTALFGAIETGSLAGTGVLDPTHMVAAGISSGGYMTSRMAVSYPGRFDALAVVSGAYATCVGAACTRPDDLPADHPPTLFAHGGRDLVVPVFTMRRYADALDAEGIPTDQVVDSWTGHSWFAEAPEHIVGWFGAHTP